MAYSPELIRAICQRYANGETSQSLAVEIGCAQTTVAAWLKKNKVSLRDGRGKHSRFSQELQELICQRYANGESSLVLAAEIGCNRSNVDQWIRERGNLRHRPQNRLKAEAAAIVGAYTEGASVYRLCQIYSCSSDAVARILKQGGVTEFRGVTGRPKRYSINDDFFAEICTEAQAYLLGFHAADGNVCFSDNRPRFSMTLAEKDSDHLRNMALLMGSTYPISSVVTRSRTGEMSKCALFYAYSKGICADLTRLGFGPRKTWKIQWPSNEVLIPNNLLRHFLRGYFDGDGSAYHRLGYPNMVQWSLCGNPSFLQGCQGFLEKHAFVRTGQRIYQSIQKLTGERTGICGLAYGSKKDVCSIFRLMYEDATIYLPRKHEILARSWNSISEG